MRYLFVLLVLLTGCGPIAVVDSTQDGSPILIRTPQLDLEELGELHKQHNLRTVINLRGADIIEDDQISWHVEEKDFCDSNGITYIWMDLNDGTAVPSDEDINLFLHMASSKPFWPIVIHCQAGIHRTGFFAALYRIQFNKWDAERAIDEMEDYWFNWSISDRSELKEYLRSYKRRTFKE